MYLTRKELTEFPLGTKLTIEGLRDGKEFIKTKQVINAGGFVRERILWYTENRKNARVDSTIIKQDIKKIEVPDGRDYKIWTRPVRILDENERIYLRQVTKPFKDDVIFIKKAILHNEYFQIEIMTHHGTVRLPYFAMSLPMYVGMIPEDIYGTEILD